MKYTTQHNPIYSLDKLILVPKSQSHSADFTEDFLASDYDSV